jgi:hypothetical protein
LFHTSFVVWNLFNPAVKPIPEHPRGLNFRCWNLQFSWELYSLSVPETAPKIRHIDLWFNVHSERGDLVIPEISQKSNHHTSIYIYTFIVQYVHVYIYTHSTHTYTHIHKPTISYLPCKTPIGAVWTFLAAGEVKDLLQRSIIQQLQWEGQMVDRS